jgi:hypothetical protein
MSLLPAFQPASLAEAEAEAVPAAADLSALCCFGSRCEVMISV